MPVSISHPDVDFTTTTSDEGRVESEITTTESDKAVTFKFTIARNRLILRVGTTSGAQDIVPDTAFDPGSWNITFSPGVGTYYLQFYLRDIGKATLRDFARVAPGDFDLETPYGEEDLSALRQAQSLNVVYLAHGSYQPRVLERRGSTSWGLRLYEPGDGPFTALNASNYTMTPSALTGEVTITASGPIFSSQDVGMLLKLTHAGQYETANVTAAEGTTDAIRVSGLGAARGFTYGVSGTFTGTWVLERSVGNELSYETVDTGTGVKATTTYNDDYDNQIIYYRLRCSAYTSGTLTFTLQNSQGVTDGVAKIVSVSADNEVTADVIDAFSKTSATVLWYFGEWSERFGYPTAIGLHDGRTAWGRNASYWLSAADSYESHLIGAEDADAIARTLTGRINSMTWLTGVKNLLAGTTGSEHHITAGQYSEVLTPSTTLSRELSTRGSAAADAVKIDQSVVFISRSRKRLYLATEDSDGGLELYDLTRLHPDIAGATGFKEIAFQREPYPRLWCVRNDGEVAILLFEPTEQIAAWTRYTAAESGSFKSVAVIPEAYQDGVYFVVDRGGDNFLIEKLAQEEFTDLEDAWRLQSAVEYSGSATTSLSGLDHLEGEDVYVWGNGRQSGPYTVSSGAITCDYEVTYAIIGLLYEGKYKGPRLSYGAQAGSSLTLQKKVEALGMLLYRTPGGAIKWGRNYEDMTVLKDRMQSGTISFDSPLQEWTSDEKMNFEGKFELDSRLHISMPSAGPATVLGLIPRLKTNEG
jgi:hypothetical protein